MGFSFRNLIRGKPEPEQSENNITFEIADSPIESMMTEIYLRELAFQRAIQILAKMLGKCEIRTFLNNEEIFRDEYYSWNYEPNRNQNKQQFFDKLVEKMFRNGEALIVSGIDGQLYVADAFCTTRSALYGNTYSQVTVDDYTFQRTFRSTDVMYVRPNWKNVNTVLKGLYGSYARLIQYGAKSFLQSHGSKGILNISSIASNAKNFDETLKKLLNEYFKTFFESENAVLPIFDGYTFTETNRSKNYNETTTRDIKAMWVTASGNARELRKMADDLDVLTASNRKIFLERSSLEEQQLMDMMEAETFLTPDDCLQYGLIDKVEDYGHAQNGAAVEEMQKRLQEVMQHMKETKSFREQLELMQNGKKPDTEKSTKKPEQKNTLQGFLQGFRKGE